TASTTRRCQRSPPNFVEQSRARRIYGHDASTISETDFGWYVRCDAKALAILRHRGNMKPLQAKLAGKLSRAGLVGLCAGIISSAGTEQTATTAYRLTILAKSGDTVLGNKLDNVCLGGPGSLNNSDTIVFGGFLAGADPFTGRVGLFTQSIRPPYDVALVAKTGDTIGG